TTMARSIFFPPFELDAENAELRRSNEPIALRPRTRAVLQWLAERPGLLVTKDELLAAVWRGTFVSETVFTVCIAELRKALGDTAEQPQFIQTVHGRGYRFMARMVDEPTVEGVCVVGRDVELSELRRAWERARRGRRQCVFVTGEPGIGKTTVVDAFVQRAKNTHGATARMARGQCVEQQGPGEPFMPLLEALARVCAQPGGERVVALLRTQAPGWLLQLPEFIGA